MVNQKETYLIVYTKSKNAYGGERTIAGIKCLICGMTSYHPMDIKYKFCGNCNKFHE